MFIIGGIFGENSIKILKLKIIPQQLRASKMNCSHGLGKATLIKERKRSKIAGAIKADEVIEEIKSEDFQNRE